MAEAKRSIARLLSGGDRRSIGRSNHVVALVKRDPARFTELVLAMQHADPLVRMRAADAAEKITLHRPEYLQTHKRVLLRVVAHDRQKEVRWHVAQMLLRLKLSKRERAAAVAILRGYLRDESRIVKTFAMQALSDLTAHDPLLRTSVLRTIRRLTETGSPAMRSRGRRLLRRLEEGARRLRPTRFYSERQYRAPLAKGPSVRVPRQSR
jgi:HEAT repeat protein